MYTECMAKKKLIAIVIFLALVGALVVFGLNFSTGEDTWICQNGEWKKNGSPSYPKPQTNCEDTKIVVIFPQPNEVIKNPLVVEGMARGFWFFEAVFPACLYDYGGEKLGCGLMQTTGDWMTADFVLFKGEIDFQPTKSENGTLVLEKNNPSGLKEKAEQIEIPVRFAATDIVPIEKIKVKAYFNNSKLAPFSCEEVFSVEREIVKTQAVTRASLEELLRGPTEKEKEKGFFTNINLGVKIQKLTIENGIAKVDFDEQMEFQMGGSCRVTAIRAQIIQTLKQFPTIKDVVISVDGRAEDILQP